MSTRRQPPGRTSTDLQRTNARRYLPRAVQLLEQFPRRGDSLPSLGEFTIPTIAPAAETQTRQLEIAERRDGLMVSYASKLSIGSCWHGFSFPDGGDVTYDRALFLTVNEHEIAPQHLHLSGISEVSVVRESARELEFLVHALLRRTIGNPQGPQIGAE